MKAKVIVFGEDERLLAVRSMVLQNRGMLVAKTDDVEHVMTVAEQFDAVVVCTSASRASSEQLQHLNKQLSHTAFVFLNHTDTADSEKWQTKVEQALRER